jgi:hypothetical protein
MKPVTETTMRTLVNALLLNYRLSCEAVAYWDKRGLATTGVAKSDEHIESCRRFDRERLQKCAAAIKELGEGAEPWLRLLDELKPIFQPEAPQPPPEEAAQ